MDGIFQGPLEIFPECGSHRYVDRICCDDTPWIQNDKALSALFCGLIKPTVSHPLLQYSDVSQENTKSTRDQPYPDVLIELANIGYWKWSPTGEADFVSPICWALLGEGQSTVGTFNQWCERVSSVDTSWCWADLEALVAVHGSETFVLQGRAVHNDGKEVHLRMRCQARRCADSNSTMTILAAVDNVTGLLQASAALRDARERFNAMAAGASGVLWDIELLSGEGFCSEQLYEVTGISDRSIELSPNFFSSHVHGDDLEMVNAALAAHLEHRTPFTIDYRVIGDDGDLRWIHAEAQAVRDADGRPVRLAGSLENITDKRKAEQELEAKQHFQNLVFATMDDLLFVKDDQFRILLANPAFLSLYPEESRDTVIGTTTLEAYDETQRAEFLAEDRRALDEGLSEVQETIDFPDGRRRTLWTKKIRFEDNDGRRYILAYARDITELKEVERALVTSNGELEEFAYRVSHDLRSPLQSSVRLLDYLKSALQEGSVEEAQAVLSTVQESLQNLSTLSRDVLDVHRIRHCDIVPQKIDLQNLVETTWSRHQLEEDHIELVTRYQLDTEAVVDPYGLNLVLDNLISNAVKYRNLETTDARVMIDITCDARDITLSVGDNGIGIPEDCRSSIFGMFQRFHPRHSIGSGLGLYMTQQWALRMGGTIAVEHLDPGTRFFVKIPQRTLAEN